TERTIYCMLKVITFINSNSVGKSGDSGKTMLKDYDASPIVPLPIQERQHPHKFVSNKLVDLYSLEVNSHGQQKFPRHQSLLASLNSLYSQESSEIDHALAQA
ncbi:MAG: hypothetical protein AAFR26_26250, partial [Cyanobacteria bacterium J06626_4]